MPAIYWTPAGEAAAPANLGIGIADPAIDPDFRAAVSSALTIIFTNSLAGQLLVNDIIANITPVGGGLPCRLTIHPPVPGNNPPRNECAAQAIPGTPQDPMTRLARAVTSNDAGNIALEIASALNNLVWNNPGGYLHVANTMNAVPNYQLAGPVAAPGAGYGVTAAHIQGWATGAAAFPAPLVPANLDTLKHALLITLQGGMTPGTGCSSIVRWNRAGNGLTIGGVFMARPPHIGLAHELIHALNDLRGLQIGINFGAPSRVLYEYMCVGLGPWANPVGIGAMPIPPLTENSIRALSHIALRPQYG